MMEVYQGEIVIHVEPFIVLGYVRAFPYDELVYTWVWLRGCIAICDVLKAFSRCNRIVHLWDFLS
jgi:hypothetical protein